MSERQTRQLVATYEAVRYARDHPTADDVHALVRRRITRVSLGTIYRNLKKLVAQGRVRIVPQPNARSTRFEAMLESHEHFLCEICNSIIDLPLPSRMLPAIAGLRRAGYGVSGHSVTFFGVCPQCRASGPGATDALGSARAKPPERVPLA
jgi:Fur family ferric uptake transcriptional regulator